MTEFGYLKKTFFVYNLFSFFFSRICLFPCLADYCLLIMENEQHEIEFQSTLEPDVIINDESVSFSAYCV